MPTEIPPVRKDNETEEEYIARIQADKDRADQEAETARQAAIAQAEANKAAEKRAASAPATTRNFQTKKEVLHDLFKLKVGVARKNVSYQKDSLQMESLEHVHFFHSIDSHGDAQKTCNFVAGHTHEISVELDDKGNIKKTLCGVAKKQVERNLGRGVIKKELAAIGFGVNAKGDNESDVHVHEIVYMRSEKIEVNV